MVGWMLVLGMVSVPAKPAEAAGVAVFFDVPTLVASIKRIWDNLVQTLKEIAILWDIIDIGLQIIGILQMLFDDLLLTISDIAKTINGGKWLTAMGRTRLLDKEMNTRMNHVLTRERMRYVMNNPKTGGVGACRAALLHQLSTTTEDYAEAVSRIVLTALESMYRGPYAAGDNAMFAAMMHQQRCTYKFASPMDGYPNGGSEGAQDCVDEETKVGTFERTFIDADLTPFMMDGAVTLEMPTMEVVEQEIAPGETMKFMQAKPENANQRAWVAALNYCVNMVGPRHKPPYGKERETPYGLMKTMIFSQGLAIEGIGDKQCADLIAYHTRPNPKQNAALIKSQRDICKSGGAEAVSPSTLSRKFDNCEKGLSPYQSEMLGNAACKSTDHYITNLKGGAFHRKLIPQTLSCAMTWNKWQKNMSSRNGALTQAVATQMAAKGVMAGMSGGQKSGQAPGLYQFVLDEAMELPEKNIYTVNLTKKRRNVERGVPVSADEISLPVTVAQ